MGYRREDVFDKTSIELNIWKNPTDRDRLRDGLRKTGYVDNLEAEFVGKDGDIRYSWMSVRVLTINNEGIIISMTHDITDRKKAEKALKAGIVGRMAQYSTPRSASNTGKVTVGAGSVFSETLPSKNRHYNPIAA